MCAALSWCGLTPLQLGLNYWGLRHDWPGSGLAAHPCARHCAEAVCDRFSLNALSRHAAKQSHPRGRFLLWPQGPCIRRARSFWCRNRAGRTPMCAALRWGGLTPLQLDGVGVARLAAHRCVRHCPDATCCRSACRHAFWSLILFLGLQNLVLRACSKLLSLWLGAKIERLFLFNQSIADCARVYTQRVLFEQDVKSG